MLAVQVAAVVSAAATALVAVVVLVLRPGPEDVATPAPPRRWRDASARLLRNGVVVGNDLRIESLRRFKDDVTEVREGYECGIGLGSFNDIKEGDVIETFEMQEKPRV